MPTDLRGEMTAEKDGLPVGTGLSSEENTSGRLSQPAKSAGMHDEALETGEVHYWRIVVAIAGKDLRTELRAREVFATMVAFSLLAVVVTGLAFDLRVPSGAMVAPGVLWIIVLYAGVIGLNRTFGAETDRGTLAALLLAPVDRSAIYFGKFAANLLFLLASEIIVLPALLVIFDVSLFAPLILLGLLLGTIGYAAVGTLFAALAASTRAREAMLPVLLLPVMVPVFVAGVGLTANVVDGHTFADVQRWLWLLGGFDLIALGLSWLLFDTIWEDA